MLSVPFPVRTAAVSMTSLRSGSIPYAFRGLSRAHSRCLHDVSAHNVLPLSGPAARHLLFLCPFPCAQPLFPRRLSAAVPCHTLSVPFPVRTAAVSATSQRSGSVPYAFRALFRAHSRSLHDVSAHNVLPLSWTAARHLLNTICFQDRHTCAVRERRDFRTALSFRIASRQ